MEGNDESEMVELDAESPATGSEPFEARVRRELQLLEPQPAACGPYPRTGGYIGRNVWICGTDSSHTFPLKCIVGPDWPCMCGTYCLVVGISAAFIWGIAFDVHFAVGVTSCILLALLLLAFTLAACTDPGIIRRIPASTFARQAKPDGYSKCGHCNLYRPRGSAHCYECDVCIEDIDHHCPWTGHCIGKRNLTYFKAFVTLLCIQLTWVLLLTVGSAINSSDVG